MCEIDLSQLLTESLNLEANTPTRMAYPRKHKDPYEYLLDKDPLEVLGEKSFGKPRKIEEYVVGTPIQEFYRGDHVFISGGTGFVGKILTEKLVRSVPHIGKIYLLIRSKRGKSAEERFSQLLEDQIFSRMKTEVPEYSSKITFVPGDISQPGLGLNVKDHQTLVENVNVLFHSAADVRFVEPLKAAISSNVVGSLRILELAKKMKHLKSYVHVSTAYSQCVRRVVPETVPRMSINYKDILNLVESMSEKDIEDNLERILQGWPNTYTFSKAVCEDMIQEEGEGLPICIFRPAAIVPTFDEPVKGWTDNLYGPLSLSVATGMGILHCYAADEEISLDMVPVDYVVNCMISSAWSTYINRQREDRVSVYNFVTDPARPIPWKLGLTLAELYITYWPSYTALWYPSFWLTNSELVSTLAHTFLHKIPGVLLDKLAVLSGQKPRLSKIYDRIQSVKQVLKWFSNRTWEFKSENVTTLWNSMTPEDKVLFHFDIRDVNPGLQCALATIGVRYYFLKEKMESLPDARRKQKWLFWAHNTLKMVFGLTVLKVMVVVAHVLPI